MSTENILVDNSQKKKEWNKKKNKKIIITIEEEIIGPHFRVKHKKYYYNNKPKEEGEEEENDTRTKREKELDVKAFESIRRKAIKDLESDDTTAKQKIDAGWRLLYSYGFEANELHKSWKWFKGH